MTPPERPRYDRTEGNCWHRLRRIPRRTGTLQNWTLCFASRAPRGYHLRVTLFVWLDPVELNCVRHPQWGCLTKRAMRRTVGKMRDSAPPSNRIECRDLLLRSCDSQGRNSAPQGGGGRRLLRHLVHKETAVY